ncbi:hypothetical protein ACSSS7_000238 [Eimeria intestinalis]
MTPGEGEAPRRRGRREVAPQTFDEMASSDPYTFIDEHEQQTERLERELEHLQLTVRKKIDRCFEEAEEKSMRLSSALPAALATVETLSAEASQSQAAAKRLLASLEATGAHQQLHSSENSGINCCSERRAAAAEGLGTLYVLQAVKKHLEDCSKIEAELLLQSLRPHSLLEASQQRAVVEAAAVSASLRHAASLLASLPEFESRLHAAKKLEQRVLSLATLLLRDSVSANSTEGFGCAVSAFESLGAQETLARELPAALRSLLQKAWKTLWLQTPAGRTEETDEEGQLLPEEESQHNTQQDHYNPSVGCVAEPEALMAYAEQWAAAVEQTAGFIRAAAASVGGARRQAASGGDSEAISTGKPAASKKSQITLSRRSSTDAHQQHPGPQRRLSEAEGHARAKKSDSLWVSLLLASMGAGADVPVESLERLLQRYRRDEHQQLQQQPQHQHQYQQAQDGLEVIIRLLRHVQLCARSHADACAFARFASSSTHNAFTRLCTAFAALGGVSAQLAEQLLAAYDVAATLISATPAFAETEAVEHHLWERFCNSVDFLPPSLLTVYGGALTRRLSALLDSQPRQAAAKKVSPSQQHFCLRTDFAAGGASRLVALPLHMEAETHAAVERLLEMIPSLSGSGSNPAAAPFVLAAADAALVEALNALSPRINTFHQPGFFLEAPPPAAVIASQEALWKPGGTPRVEGLLPHSFGTHAALMAASQDLVVSCCCTPLELFLQSCYADAVASAVAVSKSMTSGSNGNGYLASRHDQAYTYTADCTPTAAITAVGEHVLSLLPLLEDATPPADGSSWVSLLLQAVAKCYSRVLLSCLQQNKGEESATSQADNGFTDPALERQHLAGAGRTEQPQQKGRTLPCVLTKPGEQIILNDLACLQRLAETLGIGEEVESKGNVVGPLGFAYMRAEFEHFLHQPQNPGFRQTSESADGEPADAGSSGAAAALAAEVVRTAKDILRGGQQPQV